MPEDVVERNKLERDVIVSAIEALKLRGDDINPYSLADELMVSHSAIVSKGEIMELVAQARGESQGVVAAEYDGLVEKVAALTDTVSSLESEVTELRARLNSAEEENGVLFEQAKALENANQVIAASIQDAWQQGYQSAIIDFHRAEVMAQANNSLPVDDTTSGANSVDDMTSAEELLADNLGQEIEPLSEQEQIDPLAEGLNPSRKSKPRTFSEDELRDLWQYRFGKTGEEPPEPKDPESAKSAPPGTHKFVGAKHSTQEQNIPSMPRVVPHEIRRSCKLLGLKPEELNKQAVFDAWKREMAKPGVHPDTGGDTEMAMYLNTAKDTLVQFLEAQAPKLGKVFGSGSNRESANKEPPKSDPDKTTKK